MARAIPDQRLFVRLDEDPVHGPEAGAPRGTLQAFAVRPALRAQVAHILGYRESFAPGEEIVERVVPDGAVRLVLNLGDSPSSAGSPTLQVLGPSAAPALVPLRGRMHGIAVTLQPGAAASLLGVSAGEIVGAAVSLHDLSHHGSALLHRLAGLPDDAARVDALQNALARHVTPTQAADRQAAVHAQLLLAQSAGRSKVGDVAAAVGVGERRLQQLFRAHIGLSPRTWGRLARLHGCLRTLRVRPQAGWADLAADGGFYDQAHLANEFRDLCGCTPGEFRRLAVSGSSKTAD